MQSKVKAREAEENKRMDADASAVVPFLQVIFAMLFICGKTIHEQSLLIVRLSQMSRPGLYSQRQPETTGSSIPQCSCQTLATEKFATAMLNKVRNMGNMASIDLAWLNQIRAAFCVAKENAVYAVNLGVGLLYQGLVPDT